MPGSNCLIDVWAHFERQRNEVLERARDSTGEDIRSKSKGPIQLARGTVLTARLQVEDVLVDDPEDTILWQGDIGNATFAARVPREAAEGNKRGVANIYVCGLQIARIYFILKVGIKMAKTDRLPTEEHRHRKAFASYASGDRDHVLARIQGLQKAAPLLEIFFDVFSLRSGQYWEKELWNVIPANDVFYLFWSNNARQSEWVEKEWRCALQAKGLDFIDPIPLAPPTEVPPPPELAGKHFNDWVLAFTSLSSRPPVQQSRFSSILGAVRSMFGKRRQG